jgi:hypothetical protein
LLEGEALAAGVCTLGGAVRSRALALGEVQAPNKPIATQSARATVRAWPTAIPLPARMGVFTPCSLRPLGAPVNPEQPARPRGVPYSDAWRRLTDCLDSAQHGSGNADSHRPDGCRQQFFLCQDALRHAGRRGIRAPSVRHFDRIWLYTAKGVRNHNPRVGGSSPSSGIRADPLRPRSPSSKPHGAAVVSGPTASIRADPHRLPTICAPFVRLSSCDQGHHLLEWGTSRFCPA